MYWKRLSEFTRTLTFRLNVWHAAIYLVSAGLLFSLIYFLLAAAIDRKDRDVIEARLREYVAVYRGGGIPALRDWTTRVNEARKERMFFVRVVPKHGKVELLVMPQDWFDADLRRLDAATQSHALAWVRVPRNSETDLTLASKILDDGTVFQVGRSSDSRATLLGKFRQVFIMVIPPVLLLGVIGGALLTRRMTKPICELVAAVSSILNTGRMDIRVSEQAADDEVQDLVVLFNRMLDQNERLIRTLRDSLDNVAHDLRTPLARLRLTLERSLATQSMGAGGNDGIMDALDETERVQTIIRTLMDVAQAEAGLLKLNVVETDLRSLATDVVDLYEHVAEEREIDLSIQADSPILASVDPVRMRQVFANLLDNALKYTHLGGRVLISMRQLGNDAEIHFIDNGIGISEKHLPRVWERLYRADESRNTPGLGLGLSLVKAVVEMHGGRIDLRGTVGEGSEFTVVLPLVRPRHSLAASGPTFKGA